MRLQNYRNADARLRWTAALQLCILSSPGAACAAPWARTRLPHSQKAALQQHITCSAASATAQQRRAALPGLQGPPSDATRRHTAHALLSIMAGESLPDRSWERELRSAMHMLPTAGVEVKLWAALAARAQEGGPAAVQKALGWQLYHVPTVSGAQVEHCQLTSHPIARRFRKGSKLNGFVADLFEAIVAGSVAASLPRVQLTRWDLFHAHCFVTAEGGGLGLLFHAKEYPRLDEKAFPYNLGYCQRGSLLAFDARAMDMRNLLFFRGRLCALNVGKDSVLHNTLIMDGLQDVRTVLEMDFGQGIFDVNYFGELEDRDRDTRVFICDGARGDSVTA